MTRSSNGFSRRLWAIYAGLLVGNAAAWMWALGLFGGNPVLLGTAVLAYMLGLRHAVDADHIAAIDNVTRKLVQQGDKPTSVGLFFSLGHSTVVAVACGAIALTSVSLQARFAPLREVGALVGTAVSASFLVVIALANLVTLVSILRAMRVTGDDVAPLPGGLLGRALRPLMRVIRAPWQMFPLGFLFGLGFDTASEVGLLGISAGQAAHAVPLWTIMVFPALFTAGMSLLDTTDGIVMAGAYGWALVKPRRKLAYNLTVTLLSILVALVIAGLEAANLLLARLGPAGRLGHWVAILNGHFGMIGCAIAAMLVACWALFAVLARGDAQRA